MEHPIKMDDLGVPLFLETPIYRYVNLNHIFELLYIEFILFICHCCCTHHLPVIWLLYPRLIQKTKAVIEWHSYRSSCNVSVALGNPSAHNAGRFCCNFLEIIWPMTLFGTIRWSQREANGSLEHSLLADVRQGGNENRFVLV